jgi:hypothetical protein
VLHGGLLPLEVSDARLPLTGISVSATVGVRDNYTCRRVHRHLSFLKPRASTTDPGLIVTLRLDGTDRSNRRMTSPCFSMREWMDLRAYRALKDAGATWAEIARESGHDWRT